VEIPRPRDRKAINHDLHFKQLRRDVIEFMLNSRHDRHVSLTKKLVLPDIEPEDLTLPRSIVNRRTRPLRKSEIKEETVEVE
jgi:nitrate/nitrite transport system ATP-binding protein